MNTLKERLSSLLSQHCAMEVIESLFKIYVCRSIYQEHLGTVDAKMVDEIVQGQTSNDDSLLYHDTLGFVKGYQYLHQLSQCDDAGLLDNNIIQELHNILMNHRSHLCTVGKYSKKDRFVEFKGRIHCYPNPCDMEESMQLLIDQYNHRWFTLNRLRTTNYRKAFEDLLQLTAWFVFEFLELHPFGDGNGRTVRLLYTYIMESYGIPFQVSPMWLHEDSKEHYELWCCILETVRVTRNLLELKKCMIHSLQMSLKEYQLLNHQTYLLSFNFSDHL